jgi:hypothetical protein
MGLKRKEGNIFWQVLLFQKQSVQIAIKEEMEEHKYYRMFRDYYVFDEPQTMKFGIRTLDIYYRLVLPAEYKAIPNLTTYQQLERYYTDLTGSKVV